MLTIYTDGSYQSSISAGGYAVVVYDGNTIVNEWYSGYKNTTNNRMELMAIIVALEHLTNEPATIITDSMYIINNIPRVEGWLSYNDTTIKNMDLWTRFFTLYKEHPKVSYKWVKGHETTEGNIRADMLAVHAAQCLNIPTDDNNNNNPKEIGESLVSVSDTRKTSKLDDWCTSWTITESSW